MKNKRKLLFVIDSLRVAGAEKSLMNLLNCFDYNKYSVDLFLLSDTGELRPQLPPYVRIIKNECFWLAFNYPLLRSICFFMIRGKINIAIHRLIFCLKSRLNCKSQENQQKLWKHMSPALPKISGKYDGAIAYLEKYPIYTLIEKVDAVKKIGWVHIDYKSYGLSKEFDSQYFDRLDNIVTVSEQCSKVLCEVFPEYSNKISVIENIISPELLNKLAGKVSEAGKPKETVIVTMARLSYQKGIDMAVEAARMLNERGYAFKWYILGEGIERENLIRMIKNYELEEKFFLTGVKSNPYPYIKNCDIYVQPSRFEGKSIAIEEVKAICRPIVVTRFPTVCDQLTDGIDCIMTEVDAKGIYEGIKKLIDNDFTREEICKNLKKENTGNSGEINKLYALLN